MNRHNIITVDLSIQVETLGNDCSYIGRPLGCLHWLGGGGGGLDQVIKRSVARGTYINSVSIVTAQNNRKAEGWKNLLYLDAANGNS